MPPRSWHSECWHTAHCRICQGRGQRTQAGEPLRNPEQTTLIKTQALTNSATFHTCKEKVCASPTAILTAGCVGLAQTSSPREILNLIHEFVVLVWKWETELNTIKFHNQVLCDSSGLACTLSDNLLPDIIGWGSLVTLSICKQHRQHKQVISFLSERWQTWDRIFKVESNDFDFWDFNQYSLGLIALKTHTHTSLSGVYGEVKLHSPWLLGWDKEKERGLFKDTNLLPFH